MNRKLIWFLVFAMVALYSFDLIQKERQLTALRKYQEIEQSFESQIASSAERRDLYNTLRVMLDYHRWKNNG